MISKKEAVVMLLRLSGPRTAVLVPRRRRASWRFVRVVVLGILLVGGVAAGVAGWLRRVPALPAPVPVQSVTIPRESSALESEYRRVLSEIRADAEAAQLEVRISVPLVAEAGLPVTARRLSQSDARLSAIVGAVDAAAAALERNEAAAGRSKEDGGR